MMTAEMISASAGILLSLVFSYVPGLSDWFNALDGAHKRLVMLAALVLPACSQAGLLSLLEALIAALVANQATYMISPKKAASG